jgi:hypothetical protein
MVLFFTARGGGTGSSVSSWKHTANIFDPSTGKLVLRVVASSALEAAREAKAKWETEHTDEPPPRKTEATAEPENRLRQFGINTVISRTSEDPDAFWMGLAYDHDDRFVAVAVQPTLEDLWLTLAEDVLPPEDG